MSQVAAFQEAKNRLEKYTHVRAVRLVLENPAWDNLDEEEAAILRSQLLSILRNENDKKLRKLYDTVFATLILLTKYYPVNGVYNQEGIPSTAYCIMNRIPIVNPIYTATGVQIEAVTASELLDQVSILKRDAFYLYLQTKKCNVPFPAKMQGVEDEKMGLWIKIYFGLVLILSALTLATLAPVIGPWVIAVLMATAIVSGVAGFFLSRAVWKRIYEPRKQAIEESIDSLLTLAEQVDEVEQPAPAPQDNVNVQAAEEYVEDQPGLLVGDVQHAADIVAAPVLQQGEPDVIDLPELEDEVTGEMDNVILGEPDHADFSEGIPNAAFIYAAGRPRLLSWMNNAAAVVMPVEENEPAPRFAN
jgi:hypothetical protein